MIRLVLASRNVDKVGELALALEGLEIDVRPVSDYPEVGEVEETEPDLEGNAVLKAVTVARAVGDWALADDTGLEVDALDGAPGVYSARFAGPGATYEDNVELLLESLLGVEDGKRSARFRTVVALSDRQGVVTCVEGVCEGTILKNPCGDGGFGYDPVFAPDDSGGRTFSQMSRSEKGEISHRGRAMAAVRQEIRRRLADFDG